MTDLAPADVAWGRLANARRRIEAALIANAHFLEEPFTNAPETNPWERSVKPAMYALREAIAAVRAERDAAHAAGREAAAQDILDDCAGARFARLTFWRASQIARGERDA